ncbi:MAG: ligase-associated DNA damage response exonuclease [Bacteroidota bacterium]
MPLLNFTDKGMYVPAADVYIDPWRAVKKALITHGHSDHARSGSSAYLTHHQSIPILTKRLGNLNYQGVEYGEIITINGVKFSFHPAGHVLGSSQIRIEHQGEVWVASGDYKLQNDGVCTPFEPVKCNTFITESTFGLPVYNWMPQQDVFNEINEWWSKNAEQGRCSIIYAYSLGKAQRILQHVNEYIGPVYVHGAVAGMNEAYAEAGIELKPYTKVSSDIDKSLYRKALIIAPSSADASPWMKKFEPYSTAFASGWMAVRGNRRRLSADRGFVLSDHADWGEVNTAVKATEASQVLVTHGFTDTFSRWLCENGYDARPVKTEYAGEQLSTEDVNEPKA